MKSLNYCGAPIPYTVRAANSIADTLTEVSTGINLKKHRETCAKNKAKRKRKKK